VLPSRARSGAIAFGRDGRLYASDRGKVRGGPRGEGIRILPRRLGPDVVRSPGRRDRSGGLRPRGRRVHPASWRRRPTSSTASRRSPRSLGSHEARIEWTTLSEVPTVLLHGPDDDCTSEHREDRPSKRHEVVLRGLRLRPATSSMRVPHRRLPPTTPPRADLALETQRKSYAFLARGTSPAIRLRDFPGAG